MTYWLFRVDAVGWGAEPAGRGAQFARIIPGIVRFAVGGDTADLLAITFAQFADVN